MLLQKLLWHPLQSLIIHNTPNFDAIWSQYIWVSLWVCPRALLTSTASVSLLTSWATHTEFPGFPRWNRPRHMQKRLKSFQVDCRSLKCSKKRDIQWCPLSPTRVICGRKIKSCDIVNGDRDCSCWAQNYSISWQIQTTLGMLHNELKQETSQQSSNKNSIFRALTSFDNLGTTWFHFWAAEVLWNFTL